MTDIIPDVMRVVEIASPGGPEQLRPASRPTPRPGKDEVLIKVAAAGVNRPDVLQRMGVYPPPAEQATFRDWKFRERSSRRGRAQAI